MIRGATLGKFMPFHKGHKHMIDSAIAVCNHLTVIVSGKESDVIPLSTRYRWLHEEYHTYSGVDIIAHEDNIQMGEVDENGTCIDEKFWNAWEHELKSLLPDGVDYFITSDIYGKKIAEVLGCKWLPIDPGREYMPVSGTQCRESIYDCWNMLTQPVRNDFVTKVAIVGPESTGKTTLARSLSPEMTYIPEYGRHLSEVKPDLDYEDFELIAKIQDQMIDGAAWEADRPVVITDTEAYTTYLFSKFYTDKACMWSKPIAMEQNFDLYILLAPTVKWVQDGTRVVDTQERREWFFNEMKSFLDSTGRNYIVIDDPLYDDRRTKAKSAILRTQRAKGGLA